MLTFFQMSRDKKMEYVHYDITLTQEGIDEIENYLILNGLYSDK